MVTKNPTFRPGVRWRSLRALLRMSVVTGLCLLLPVAGHADDGDQERALRALRAGEVLPLRTMLVEVEKHFSGNILEVELDDDKRNGRRVWTYKIKLISPDGNVIKLKIDAKTKEILQIKGRGADKARKK